MDFQYPSTISCARKEKPLEIVTVGILSPAEVYAVENVPTWDKGQEWTSRADYISEDASIVAIAAKGWGLNVGMVAGSLGDDISGHNVLRELRRIGVEGDFRIDKSIRTPYEIVFSDRSGGRTYIWDRRLEVLETLASANVSIVGRSQHLYADWYDWPFNKRSLIEACSLGVPVLINMEDKHLDPKLSEALYPFADTIQISLGNFADDPNLGFIDNAFHMGVQSVLITGGSSGCRYVSQSESFILEAPSGHVIDANGAGAIFSTGYLFGVTSGFNKRDSMAFAVAAASLHCQQLGPTTEALVTVRSVADTIAIRE